MTKLKRTAYFDNAKVLLIFLVVFGHMLQPSTEGSAILSTLYMWIYTFHMPAFILLSGLFAKGAGNLDYLIQMAKKILLPYVLFQAIYAGFYWLMGKEAWRGFIEPQWSLWFLLSLFSWHMLLILFKKLPAVIGISIALLIGVSVGYLSEIGSTLSLSRTFVFFPFFLIGYWSSEKQFMRLKTTVVRYTGIVIMAAVAIFIYTAPEINTGWLLASKSYADLGMPVWGGLGRLLVYTIALLMSVSVLAWMPRRVLLITPIGQTTLYIYLLHGFFIQYFRSHALFDISSLVDLIGVGLISGAIVVFLANKKVRAIWQPFIEVKMSILRSLLKKRKQEQL